MNSATPTTMSASRLAFEEVVKSGQNWLSWIVGASEFEATLRNKIPWSEFNKKERETIQARLKESPPQQQILLNSFYVTMVSGFEEFLRGYIKEIANSISNSKIKFEEMDLKLRRTNVRESARLLRRMDSPPDYLKFDEFELCRKLGTCTPGSTAIELNGDALSEIDGLLKLSSFIERVEIFGKNLTWDHFGAQSSVKGALNMSKEKPRAVGKALEDELNTIARFRNRIAHTGGNAADITPLIFSQHREVLCAAASAIDES